MNNGDSPASPLPIAMNEQQSLSIEMHQGDASHNGLTKREDFAKAALQGILSNTDWIAHSWDDAAKSAIRAADALLEELSK